jgi:hypothetical protein
LALIPYSSIKPTLDQIRGEAASAGIPERMTYSVIGKSAGGRDLYGVVINALETTAQRRDFARWQHIREVELTDPVKAQELLASYGSDVKIPIYIESGIDAAEYEGTDAMMQAIRDLTVLPRGANPTVDNLLDHALLIIVPCMGPDGRILGDDENELGIDMNRDLLSQTQPEIQAVVRLQQEYMAAAGLDMHGYHNPTLIDGLTIPHNPGLQYDIFGKWNQMRTAQNKVDFNAIGLQVDRPVNDWGPNGALFTRHSTQKAIARTNGATESGTTVTITTSQAHSLSVGDSVIVAGVGPWVAGYNGTWTVASVPTATSFTYEATESGLPTLGGGAVWTAAYGAGTAPGPDVAQGWDDWGPFYGQTYEAFMGVDSSTVEMSGQDRLISKTCQYMAFYSSANFWVNHRAEMLDDQLEIFRRGLENAPTDPSAIESVPLLAGLGFTDEMNNWMATYAKAYIIPFGAGQRSNAEANRLVEWLLKNGIRVTMLDGDYTWGSATFKAGSYVVWMNQALRGLAWNALAPGVDIVDRISTLYSPPAAWSEGLVLGADTVEVPRADTAFAPKTTLVMAPNALSGGVRGGVDAASSWYSASLKGVRECKAVLALLKDGVLAEMAEEPFNSTTGGPMPAGTLIFPADAATATKLDAAGLAAGLWFERNVGVAKPATSVVAGVPRIAILVDELLPSRVVEGGRTNGSAPDTKGASAKEILAMRETDGIMKLLFGKAAWVPAIVGAESVQNAAIDPLLSYDVIYNAYATYPSAANATALARMNAYFARGGGYIATAQAPRAIQFLNDGALLSGSLTLSSQPAFGGIAQWTNSGAGKSPITGAYPDTDTVFLPQETTYFSATPEGAQIDGKYLPSFATTGRSNGYVAGMWLNRLPAANDAPIFVHGSTTTGSRYVASAVNLVSRMAPEREWPLIVQAALWSDRSDEGAIAYTISASAGEGGTISPSGDKLVAVGASQTYVITPDVGYEIADVKVDGASVGAVSSYAFNNVSISHTIEASFADKAAPTVTDDAPLGWHRRPVRVTLAASDLGSGVAKVEFKVDNAATWTTGTSVLIAAPKGGANDGRHTITYHAADKSGNVSADATCTVRIDTVGPTTRVLGGKTLRVEQGHKVTLRYVVTDKFSAKAKVTVLVKKSSGKIVARWAVGNVSTAKTHSYSHRVGLARGAYTCVLKANDQAGNAQVRAGSKRMIVK